MADMYDTPLSRFMPRAFVQDEETLALINAIDGEMQPALDAVASINYMRSPQEWDSDLTDELAWQNHVDFYESALPVEQRRELVKGAYMFHRKKGTNGAVKDLINLLFADGRVEDWYEYGGQPGHFRVLTSDTTVTTDRALEFVRALDSVKRLSAKLDAVIIEESEELNHYFGFGLQMGDIITI